MKPAASALLAGKVALIVAASVAFAVSLGKDVNWDLLNYHLYAPHMALHDRMSLDYMGGGPQSYFNPIALMPFYAMVRLDWPPMLIAGILAAAHSLNLVFVYLISRQVVFRDHPQAEIWSWISVVLAALSPVFWSVAGSTFTDAWVSIPVMAGAWALGQSLRSPQKLKWIAAAGLLMGIAGGLKITAFLFAAVAAMTIFGLPHTGIDFKRRVLAVSLFCLACVAGWLLIGGWWAWRLMVEFGNPFFPLFNQLFHSPDYPQTAIGHYRFSAADWADYLWLPLRMALSSSWVYVENSSPDLRPAALMLMALVIGAQRLIRSPVSAKSGAAHLSFVAIFVVLSYLLWYSISGNGRYALPLILLVGVLLAGVLSLLRARQWPLVLAMGVVILQAGVFMFSGNPRWNPVPWGARWLELDVPKRLEDQPHGFLSLHINSTSFVAPFVHEGSGFLALSGILPAYPGGYGDARVRRFLDHYSGALEALIYTGDSADGEFKAKAWHPGLEPWGLQLKPETCARLVHLPTPSPGMALYSCSVTRSLELSQQFEEERKKLTPLFDKVQRACPKLFDPPDWPLVKQGPLWVRRHLATDIVVFMRGGRFYYSRYDFGPFDVDLGSVEDWESGRAKPDCTMPAPHYRREN